MVGLDQANASIQRQTIVGLGNDVIDYGYEWVTDRHAPSLPHRRREPHRRSTVRLTSL
jgi:hypothetical protein